VLAHLLSFKLLCLWRATQQRCCAADALRDAWGKKLLKCMLQSWFAACRAGLLHRLVLRLVWSWRLRLGTSMLCMAAQA
jgi:hypothetical protein